MFRVTAFVMAVSGLGLGSSVRADETEDNAVAFVEKHSGKVTRNEKEPGKPVVEVKLAVAPVTGAGLKELAVFKSLTTLDLRLAKVTDVGLKELAALKSLTTLLLERAQVTDAGLKELVPLKNLTELTLGGCPQVTDAGLKELVPLKNLVS